MKAQLQASSVPTSSAGVGPRFTLLKDGDLASLGDISWVIKDHVPEQALGTVFGLPGAAKSFLVLDWALHVTTGIGPWNGYEVEPGRVVYVAAEGIKGFNSRIEAWKAKHGWQGHVDLHFINEPVQLDDKKHIEALVKLLQSHAVKPRLIIFDTFARCFAGDDNSARDVGAVVRAMDELRLSLGATVLLVHHSTKTDATFRGSGALEGAMDVMVHMQIDGDSVTASCRKLKDAEQFETLKFTLERIAGSRVLAHTGVAAHPGDGVPLPLSAKEEATLSALGLEALRHNEWQKQADLAGVPEGSFDRHRKKLLSLGLVLATGNGMYVRPSASEGSVITSPATLDNDSDTSTPRTDDPLMSQERGFESTDVAVA